ncbi:unnamed protein product [Symbiodinium necroappetens]|uniref:Uncharacterized protein n=1 Tax=Symbiodinium necroappetens TaxID=1628268 RepID=A0A813B169_9DINO|nr:unnamed protein product [Symbiodinium necroappetens]
MPQCKDCPDAACSCCLLELPPLPSCLGPAVWTNREVPPQDWGMTATQFREFLSECRQTALWPWIKEMRNVVTLYDIIQQLVKPWTRGTGCGIALLMSGNVDDLPHVGRILTAILSNLRWKEDMDECEEAIVDYCLEVTSGLSTSIWFCGFAQYQAGDEPGDVGPSISEQLKLDPFGSVIRHTTPALGMVVVHTSSARVYERLWCVYEIAEATRLESKVGIAFSERYLNQRQSSLVELLKARTDSAVCSNPADAEMIRSRIQDLGGFRALDWKIFSFRLQSLRAVLAKKDPNWQDMLADELQRAEEELNNWSFDSAAKFARLSSQAEVGLGITGVVVAAALKATSTTEDNWPEPDGTTTTAGFGTSGHGWPAPAPPPPEDDWPAPPPPPPPPPPPMRQQEPLGGVSPSMDTPLLVTLVSVLLLGGVCLLLVCVLAMRRCRVPARRTAQDSPLERSQLDWEEKLKLAKAETAENDGKSTADGKGPTPALPAPKVATMVIESDSDTEKGKAPAPAPPTAPPAAAPPAAVPPPPAAAAPAQEKEKSKKEKKEKKKKAKSSSSSDSDSDSDAPKKKRRINNFSSLRNIEKERAEVRKNRNAGADAAAAMLKALSDNPYFVSFCHLWAQTVGPVERADVTRQTRPGHCWLCAMQPQAFLTFLPIFVILRYNLFEEPLPKKVVQTPSVLPSLTPQSQATNAWQAEGKADPATDARGECGFGNCLAAVPACIPKGSMAALCEPSQGKPGNVSWLQVNETWPTMPQT